MFTSIIILKRLQLSCRYYIEQNTIKYSSPVRFGASAKMPKYFEFTNNHSDVFLVGNSQLDGFTGLDKDKKCGMNISMCRGATIEDCLAECETRYHNMRHRRSWVIFRGGPTILSCQNSILSCQKFFLSGGAKFLIPYLQVTV